MATNEEDQQVEDTTSASEETSEETTEAAQEEATEETSQDIDYVTELARVTKQLGQAEHTIVTLKKAKEPAPEYTSTEETAAAAPDIEAVVRQTMQQVTAEQQIDQSSSSPAEAALTKFHFNNSIVRTGNIVEDIANARALANRRKVEQQIGELRRTATKPKASSTATSAGQTVETKPAIQLSAQEQDLVRRGIMTAEEIAKSR